MGPFKLQISKYAERLDFTQLDERRKTALFNGIQVNGPRAGPQTRQNALAVARRMLALLEEQAAGFTSLTIPASLQIELEDKRKEVARLESELQTAAQPTGSLAAEPLPAEFEIYRFLVAPRFLPGKPKTKRWRARASYELADRVLIEVEPGSDRIRFWGITPQSLTSANEPTTEYEGEALFELGIPQVGHLALRGKAKDAARTGRSVIIATRTDEYAQWVFLKPRIHDDPSFQMEILCTVPTDLPAEGRFLKCKAKVSAGGRTLHQKSQNIWTK